MLFVTNDVKLNIFSGNLHSSLPKWIPVCKYPDKGPPSPPCHCQTQHVYPDQWQWGVTPWHSDIWALDILWPQSTNNESGWQRTKSIRLWLHFYSLLVLDNLVIFKNFENKVKSLVSSLFPWLHYNVQQKMVQED